MTFLPVLAVRIRYECQLLPLPRVKLPRTLDRFRYSQFNYRRLSENVAQATVFLGV